MEREQLREEVLKSEEYKQAREAFDKIFSFTSSVFLRHSDHIQLSNAFNIVDQVLALGVENKVKERLEAEKTDKKDQE
jgi:hypothetical protein